MDDDVGCCNGSEWKREDIPEHKFDFVDVEEFANPKIWRRLCYSSVFILTLKSILVYMADIGVVVAAFITGSFANAISNPNNVGCPSSGGFTSCVNGGIATKLVPLQYRVWITLATVLLSFILLYIDVRRANEIIASRDISYSVTSTIAYRFYSLRSYPHYCLFNEISDSKKGTDTLAFFVFFSLKGWKRLLLAEFPRQFINGLNLYDIVVSNVPANHTTADIFTAFFQAVTRIIAGQDKVAVAGLLLTTFTVSVWIISFSSLVIAGIVYIPMACVIRGNLKEYCCKKIDKRIGELLRKMSRKRVERARRIAMLEAEERAKMNIFIDPNSPKRAAPPVGLGIGPTLPNLDVDLNKPLKFEAFIRNSLMNGNRDLFPESILGNKNQDYDYRSQNVFSAPPQVLPLSARDTLLSEQPSHKVLSPQLSRTLAPPAQNYLRTSPASQVPYSSVTSPISPHMPPYASHNGGSANSSVRARSPPRRAPPNIQASSSRPPFSTSASQTSHSSNRQ